MTPQNRIHELDAARGFCILAMVAVHLMYDLTELYPVLSIQYPSPFLFVKEQGGIIFFLISGIAATLGHRHLRRALIVLGCAAAVSVVTILSGALPIRFGVLHCLGLCMLLWPVFQKLPRKELFFSAAAAWAIGMICPDFSVRAPFLYPLGLMAPDFVSADFFPLLPYLGYFLLGACIGRTIYAKRQSLFPRFPAHRPLFRFFCLCGRHSLFIYLIHQPVLILTIEAALA